MAAQPRHFLMRVCALSGTIAKHNMPDTTANLPIGQQVSLPGHFNVPVVLEAARPVGRGFECRVRLPDGSLDEAVLTAEEAATLTGSVPTADAKIPLANPDVGWTKPLARN
jgi:hypothetical protein